MSMADDLRAHAVLCRDRAQNLEHGLCRTALLDEADLCEASAARLDQPPTSAEPGDHRPEANG